MRRAAEGALWTLGEEADVEELFEVARQRPRTDEADGHVFISYCWDEQRMALLLKAELEKLGYRRGRGDGVQETGELAVHETLTT